jgi:uncharacterized protein YbjT (DUF2867 family)
MRGVREFPIAGSVTGHRARTPCETTARAAALRPPAARRRASPIASTVIAPSGYFADMGAVLSMARAGRVWLFGAGAARINPILGADLAAAVADATGAGVSRIDVGGPKTFTQADIARLAFETLERPARIARLPDALRKLALVLLPRVTPRRVHGPAQFFLTAIALDMVGQAYGHRRLADHFRDLSAPIRATDPEGAVP